jgi:hypothetical protein
MNIPKWFSRLSFSLFVFAVVGSIGPLTVFCQTEKLGIIQYTPPTGMSKTPKENVVSFSQFDQTAGTYCIITLYGATRGTESPQGDFTREWNNLVVTSFKTADKPSIDTTNAEGWTINAGGGAVEGDMGKAVAFLTVVSGFGQTVSILAVFNGKEYVGQVDAFVKGIELDKPALPQNPPAQPATQDGKVVIPMPSRQLTVADLVGEWGETAGFSTTYVDRYSGSYAGTDSLHFRNKRTITKGGRYVNDFFAIQNGKKIIDKTSGTVSINGRLLSIRQHNTAKYVIRGWLELTDMTILTVCGPWYDDQVIPERIFTTTEQGANLNANWIRKK